MSYFTISLITSGILGFLLIYLWLSYNSFISSRNRVKTDFSDIDVQLKRRASLIENLVEVVKGYAKHEKETFENVTKARSLLTQAHDAGSAVKADNILTSALKSLFAVSENYPSLKANENFQQLSKDLKETEDNIAKYRETYNQTVLEYNTQIQTFPNFLVAALFGFSEENFFQTLGVNEAQTPSVQNQL